MCNRLFPRLRVDQERCDAVALSAFTSDIVQWYAMHVMDLMPSRSLCWLACMYLCLFCKSHILVLMRAVTLKQNLRQDTTDDLL